MNGRALLWTFAAAGALAGCRSDPNLPILERELRLQEQDIYALSDQVDGLQQQLESSRRENASLKKELASAGDSGVPKVELPGAGTTRPDDDRRPPESNGTKPPKIDLGTETLPDPGARLRDEKKPVSDAPTDRKDDAQESPSHPRPPESSSPDDETSKDFRDNRSTPDDAGAALRSSVRRITIHPRLSGGNDADGKPGDEGLMAVVEPRDAAGKLLDAAGDISLVVLDPANTGAASRVAQWGFTADELASRYRKGPLGTGYFFELPWPSQPPEHRRLNLQVRFTTPDGRTLAAEHPFDVDLMPNVGWAKAKERPARSAERGTRNAERGTPSNGHDAPYATARKPERTATSNDRVGGRDVDAANSSRVKRPEWRPTRD